jgi:hypothetical protein
VSVVSGSVSGRGVDGSPVVSQRSSLLNSSKLANTGVSLVLSPKTKLLLRGWFSSSDISSCSFFGGDSLGGLKVLPLFEDVSVSGCLASWERRDVR